jgi:PhnB protein
MNPQAGPTSMDAQAVGGGATEAKPVFNFYGWRLGRIVDPLGHQWEIGKPVS